LGIKNFTLYTVPNAPGLPVVLVKYVNGIDVPPIGDNTSSLKLPWVLAEPFVQPFPPASNAVNAYHPDGNPSRLIWYAIPLQHKCPDPVV
jgi:hypothetical protein